MKRIETMSIRRHVAWMAVVAFLWTGLVGAAVAQDETLPLLPYRGLRPMGLGNTYEAVANDLDALNYNPAGVAQIERVTLRIVPAQARMTFDLAEQGEQLPDLIDDINALSQLSEEEMLRSDVADRLVQRVKDLRRQNLKALMNLGVAEVAVPLPSIAGFRLVGAAGVSNQLLTGVRLGRAGIAWKSEILDVLDDPVNLQGSIDILTLQFAVAGEKDLDLPYIEKLRAGIGYRLIRRRYKADLFSIADMLDPETFKEEHLDTTLEGSDEIASFSDIIDIIDNNTERQFGFSADVGVQIDHTDYLTSAIAVRSLVSDIGDAKFPTTKTFSVAARPLRFLKIENPLLDLLVAAGLSSGAGDDAHDEFRNDSFTDNLHLGAEVKLLPRSPINVALRIGNNQGYTTAGIDVQLLIFHVGAGFYGDLETDWWTFGTSINF